jgi:hypothetical protein
MHQSVYLGFLNHFVNCKSKGRLFDPWMDVSELRTQKTTECAADIVALCFVYLGHQNHGLQRLQALAEQIALLYQGNLLFHSGTEPEELTNFVKCSTEA